MKTLILMALLVLVSGCQTMEANLPASRMVSPEAMGSTEKRVGFQVGVSATQDLTLSDDASARPPDLSRPTLEKGVDTSGRIDYAASDRFDIGLKTTSFYSPVFLEGKFQLIGNPRSSAKAGDFSLSITGALGYWNVERGGNQKGIVGPGGFNWHSSVKEKVVDVGLIAGYRVSDRALIYLGAFSQNVKIEGSVHDDLSDDGTSPVADYSVDYTGKQRGADLGAMLDFGTSAYLVVEATYSHMEFESGIKNWFVGGSAAMGARF